MFTCSRAGRGAQGQVRGAQCADHLAQVGRPLHAGTAFRLCGWLGVSVCFLGAPRLARSLWLRFRLLRWCSAPWDTFSSMPLCVGLLLRGAASLSGCCMSPLACSPLACCCVRLLCGRCVLFASPHQRRVTTPAGTMQAAASKDHGAQSGGGEGGGGEGGGGGAGGVVIGGGGALAFAPSRARSSLLREPGSVLLVRSVWLWLSLRCRRQLSTQTPSVVFRAVFAVADCVGLRRLLMIAVVHSQQTPPRARRNASARPAWARSSRPSCWPRSAAARK